MANFIRFRPKNAYGMTPSQVDSAEASFDYQLNYARDVLIGVVNKESRVGGPVYELIDQDKKEITVSVDWRHGGYKAVFTFNGRFKSDEKLRKGSSR